ncbi:hypothetical protein WJX72_003911 [[Myrmecia] bisecta]|uniref:Uncharacterized protein n=1 Tax=[Myrmecia] bisecta TaxID=41462 RepID=A0AAW1R5P1_9CHLO
MATVGKRFQCHPARSGRMPCRARPVFRAQLPITQQPGVIQTAQNKLQGIGRAGAVLGAAALFLTQPAYAKVKESAFQRSQAAEQELERLIEQRGHRTGILDELLQSPALKGGAQGPVDRPTPPPAFEVDASQPVRKGTVDELPRVPEPLPPAALPEAAEPEGSVRIYGGDLPTLPPQLREAQDKGSEKAAPPPPADIPGAKVELSSPAASQDTAPEPGLPASELLAPPPSVPSAPAQPQISPRAEPADAAPAASLFSGPKAEDPLAPKLGAPSDAGPSPFGDLFAAPQRSAARSTQPPAAVSGAADKAPGPNILAVTIGGVVAAAVGVFTLTASSAREAEEKELVKSQNEKSG